MNPSFTNWLGQNIAVGDTVVYPRLSGRSCHLQEGVLVELSLMTEEEARRQYGSRRVRRDGRTFQEELPREKWEHHIGRPTRAKVQPTERSSRWRTSAGRERPVILHANAESMIRAREEAEVDEAYQEGYGMGDRDANMQRDMMTEIN